MSTLPTPNTEVYVQLESLHVRCRVLESKRAYGNLRVLICPVNGRGEQWVDAKRIEPVEDVAVNW